MKYMDKPAIFLHVFRFVEEEAPGGYGPVDRTQGIISSEGHKTLVPLEEEHI